MAQVFIIACYCFDQIIGHKLDIILTYDFFEKGSGETKVYGFGVPQFTLYADIKKGNRPGFSDSAVPEHAKKYWEEFNSLLEVENLIVEKGVFGAHMEVSLINDGPVTIWMDSKSFKNSDTTCLQKNIER